MEEKVKKENLYEENDFELYLELKKEKQDVFEFIIKKYRKDIIFYIYKFVNRLEIAEELAQDTFVYLFINKEKYNPKYSLKSYLLLIAKSRAINFLKKEKRISIVDEKYILQCESKENIEMELLKEEQKQELYNYIKKIRKNYQEAIFLKDIQELTYQEIAKILNKTIPQTKILIYRARKALERVIKEGKESC